MFVPIKSIKRSFFTHRTSFSFNKSFLTIARIISCELPSKQHYKNQPRWTRFQLRRHRLTTKVNHSCCSFFFAFCVLFARSDGRWSAVLIAISLARFSKCSTYIDYRLWGFSLFYGGDLMTFDSLLNISYKWLKLDRRSSGHEKFTLIFFPVISFSSLDSSILLSIIIQF